MKLCLAAFLVMLSGATLMAHAGNGDLIVDGKLGVGTTNPYGPLDIIVKYPNVTTSATNYNKGIDVQAFTLPISAGVTDSGYRIGIAAENFTNDINFKGTLDRQYGIWARVGSNSTNPTGNINKSYGVYIDNLDGGATVTNKFGLYQSNGTAKNYFAGNVGIGTNSPSEKLEVYGTIQTNGTGGLGRIVLKSTAVGGHQYEWYPDTVGVGSLGLFDRTASAHRLVVNAAGNVGIGTKYPDYTLDVNGTIRGNNVSPSDIRLKENILPIESALDKVADLQGVSFTWKKEESNKNFPEGRHYGVIAQEIEKVLPEVVNTAPDGTKAVAYTEIIPVLIEAIKEQQRVIEKQQQEIYEIRATISTCPKE